MQADEFDKQFDRGDDITSDLGPTRARVPARNPIARWTHTP